MKTIIDTLDGRGFLELVTNTGLGEAASARLVWYVGFDPTGPSLHLGHLLPIMALRHCQLAGHEVICVVGGATAQVGDPSGKSTERPLLSVEQVQANAEAIRGQLARLLDFSGPNAARMVDNAEWLSAMPLMTFLRDVGKHFPVREMMRKDSVSRRLEDGERGMSFTEFAYMTLQALDWLHLYDRFGCTVQMGGRDQWGNIEIGMSYLTRMRDARAHGVTLKLLTTASGEKFGKTAGQGELWLDPERTSPFTLYQFWMNTSDEDVIRMLKLFTFLDLDEIETIEAEMQVRPESRAAQRCLAHESVALLHGAETADAVTRASEILFGDRTEPLSADEAYVLAREIPTTTLLNGARAHGLELLEALVTTRLAPSVGRARRLVREGGVYVNNVRVADEGAVLGPGRFDPAGALLLRVGRKTNHLLRVGE